MLVSPGWCLSSHPPPQGDPIIYRTRGKQMWVFVRVLAKCQMPISQSLFTGVTQDASGLMHRGGDKCSAQ